MAFVYWAHLAEHTDMFLQGYIGITSKDVKTRMYQHKAETKGVRKDLPFKRAILKYGDAILVDTILEGSLEYCLEVERKLRPSVSIGWNIAIGGDSPRLGSKATEETKAKQSKSQTGRKHTEETKAKIGKANSERIWTEDSKAKLSRANVGKKISEDQRQKISLAGIGRVFTEETKAKLRPHWDAKTFSDKARECALVYLKGLKSWEVHSARANRHVWLLAREMFDYLLTKPSAGSKRLSTQFKLKECSVMGILKKFRSGWNPHEDGAYLLWVEEYTKEEIAA